MANTFNLGGSPLGLIGVSSRPSQDGMSTFNGGKSRNVNVSKYNSGKKQDGKRVSLFSGGSIPNFWPNIGIGGTEKDETGTKNPDSYKGINRNTLHNNDVYDTSVLNIIEKLSSSNRAALRPQDFAYLKYLGVYPNNRLMIARRFQTPMKDNIMVKGGAAPLSVLISWKPETEADFLNFTFGEEWTEAAADFTDVLNKMGENFGISGAGSGAKKGLNALPLPGFTELLQRDLLTELGLLNPDDLSKPLPTGNPNIIKTAKRRKTIAYGEASSGLKCKVSIKMVCEYEQKFISGIDPTIAWMDIIQNILSFGTQESSNSGLSEKFLGKINRWTDGTKGIQNLVDDVITALTNTFIKLKETLSKVVDAVEEAVADPAEAAKATGELASKLFAAALISANKTIEKYRIELIGIASALSGAPSTPWHITLGNPLRPIFCSGDMLVEDVTLTLGSTLAFNDLPSNIKAEFSMTNARALGLQEIMAKFNTGYLRTVSVRRDFSVSTNLSETSESINSARAAAAKIAQAKPESAASTAEIAPPSRSGSSEEINNKQNSRQSTQNRNA
jgi:hypothetical protein